MQFSSMLTAACCILFSFAAQAKDESFIDLHYQAETAPNEKPYAQSGCTLFIKAPLDTRRNQETLGTTFRDNPIISKEPATLWLLAALKDLKRLGINATLIEPNPAPLNGNMLTTELDKLYLWYHSMNMYGTMVVNTSFQTSSGNVFKHSYRVIGTKSNWANTDGEYVTTFNITATRFLNQLAADLQRECKT
jgi:ABC-type taurine transport system substrate-binding protein